MSNFRAFKADLPTYLCRRALQQLVRLPAPFSPWLPDGYGQIFRSNVFGPSGFWTMAPLHYVAKCDPFLSLDCAPTPSTLAQSKERKGSNFTIWQPWRRLQNQSFFSLCRLLSVFDRPATSTSTGRFSSNSSAPENQVVRDFYW